MRTLTALYGVLLRAQISIGRMVGVAALGLLAVVLGAIARTDDDPTHAVSAVVSNYGLAILVPLAALMLGTSAIGDLVDDRLLVYLWLKPVPRWQVPAMAILATASVVLPLTAIPLAVAPVVAGASDGAGRAFVAAALCGLAYSGVFVAAGFWFKRAVWWGLAYVLIWENVVAHAVPGSRHWTILGWGGALLAGAGVDVKVDAGSAAAAVVVLPLLAVAGAAAATWRYRRADVD